MASEKLATCPKTHTYEVKKAVWSPGLYDSKIHSFNEFWFPICCMVSVSVGKAIEKLEPQFSQLLIVE